MPRSRLPTCRVRAAVPPQNQNFHIGICTGVSCRQIPRWEKRILLVNDSTRLTQNVEITDNRGPSTMIQSTKGESPVSTICMQQQTHNVTVTQETSSGSQLLKSIPILFFPVGKQYGVETLHFYCQAHVWLGPSTTPVLRPSCHLQSRFCLFRYGKRGQGTGHYFHPCLAYRHLPPESPPEVIGSVHMSLKVPKVQILDERKQKANPLNDSAIKSGPNYRHYRQQTAVDHHVKFSSKINI